MSELHGKFAALAREMGKDNYPMLPESDKGPLAYGMIPSYLAEEFESKYRLMIAGALVENEKSPVYEMDVEVVAKGLDKKLIREVNKAFYLGLLDGASEANALLV